MAKKQAGKNTEAKAALSFQEWIDAGKGEKLSYGEQVKQWHAANYPDSPVLDIFAERCDRWTRRNALCDTLTGAQWTLIRHYINEATTDRGDPYENPLGFIESTCGFMDPLCRIAEGIHEERLSPTFDEKALLAFCVVENIGLRDPAFERARELNLLKTAKQKPTKQTPKGRPGRKPASLKDQQRDAAIYAALVNGDTYEGLAERYKMTKTKLQLARQRHAKRLTRKQKRAD